MLLSALAIKLYDGGPVFFRQERITGGAYGPRKFKIIKFRTMVCDAENNGSMITPKNDSRITPVGRLLRRFKIDEMPQLFNILNGDMSFVGPRPQTLGYVEKFKKHYEFIHSVVPAGLTDLATIRFRNEEELLSGSDDPEKLYVEKIMPDKIAWHEQYVKRINPLLDFWILFMTIVLVLIKR
jgi:lipopolysaccharide/colanic/teichoic acid biosynthesis glycosyltransferase